MTRTDYTGPDVRDPEQRAEAFAGLTARLDRKKADELRWVSLPVYRLPQIEDKK